MFTRSVPHCRCEFSESSVHVNTGRVNPTLACLAGRCQRCVPPARIRRLHTHGDMGGGVMTSAGERREKVASVRALVEKRGANPDADEARAHARAVHFTLFK